MLDIYIDADGCPVKDEVYKVARRYGLQVFVVCNTAMNVPLDERIQRVVVPGKFDAADDWIVEHVGERDIVITADIPLASRSLEKGARVIGTKGHPFTEESIGDALATRELMDQLRQSGVVRGGPAPMGKEDRSRFLSELDRTIQKTKRTKGT